MEGKFTEEIINEMLEQIKRPRKHITTVEEAIIENEIIIAQRQELITRFGELVK